VLDVFRVALGLGGLALEEDVWGRVNRDLEQVLKGERDIVELVAAAIYSPLGRKAPRRMETEVIIDNRSSEENTVVDVFCQDRAGLLFAITHTIFELGHVIHLARISTNSDYAFDVFYITDGAGQKIEDLERMRALEAALRGRLEVPPSAAAAG
jgi:[protein-PII] uridylyltransferase